MRILMLTAWLLLPVVAVAWHYGPGQKQMKLDDAARELAIADAFAEQGQWADAEFAYGEALDLIPEDRTEARQRLRLKRAKAQMLSSQLPAAYDELTALVEELEAAEDADAELVTEARSTMANARYYLTWLMRLEGEPKDVWEPEIEAARQTYKLLAQGAEDADTEAKYKEDLEATIRLARMDLRDLQALKIPSQCNGCCSGQCACKSMKKGKKKAEDVRGASDAQPVDQSGH